MTASIVRNHFRTLKYVILTSIVFVVSTSASGVASAAAIYTQVLSPDSLALPSGNLLGGLLPTASGGSYGTSNYALSAPIQVLTDGIIGPLGCCTASDTFFVGDGGVNITINLPTPSTIGEIDTYTNWNYDRIAQLYTIFTSTDGTNFTPLITVDDRYNAAANVLLGKVTGFSLSGVEAIRWSFDTTQAGEGFHGIAYSELAAYSTAATPEPASLLLFGSGLLVVAGWLRRRKA